MNANKKYETYAFVFIENYGGKEKMKLNDLCGQHVFSGCELRTEHIENIWG